MKPETWLMPKCKTSHVMISYSPNIAQFLLFQLVSLETSFLILGFLQTHQLPIKNLIKSPPKTIFFFGYNYQLFQVVFVEWRK